MVTARQSLALLLVLSVLTGCATTAKPQQREKVRFDYIKPAAYPLDKRYKKIAIVFDAQDLEWPEEGIRLRNLLLNWVESSQQAHIVLNLHFSDSFLIERLAGVRKEVSFDEQGRRGTVQHVPIQRAYIRTHYSLELVDQLSDQLIYQHQGAGNYPLEVADVANKMENKILLQQGFFEEVTVARYELMMQLWKSIQSDHLKPILVEFGRDDYELVAEHEAEARLAMAFDLLLENNKKSAAIALQLYNQALKDQTQQLQSAEQTGQDTQAIKQVLAWIDEGITVSTQIVNHEYQARYPPE